ncbi:hypothetical protein Hypma_013877 [Hypsizygus marmoreus]|uniref:Uncharacterized protein n=1 Tax=Hypsizygus marmoreus TaxID=39966 RepID=A0A369K595_HYPMA|nr:hypothetical protein Hypma_013877 [Hypsizygus marmoreus]
MPLSRRMVESSRQERPNPQIGLSVANLLCPYDPDAFNAIRALYCRQRKYLRLVYGKRVVKRRGFIPVRYRSFRFWAFDTAKQAFTHFVLWLPFPTRIVETENSANDKCPVFSFADPKLVIPALSMHNDFHYS